MCAVSQIYVCTDEDNNLAEIRFYCDPDMDGNSQCFKEAGRLNVDALDINVRAARDGLVWLLLTLPFLGFVIRLNFVCESGRVEMCDMGDMSHPVITAALFRPTFVTFLTG